jgi:serine/threonine protein kinase
MAKLWGIVVAVKILKPTGVSSQADMARELAVLRSLRHPNCVMLVGHAVRPSDSATLLVMEYMERGSLHGLIHDAKAQICEDDVLSIAVQLSQGLRYLHEQDPPLFHRDLSSFNVLVDRDGTCKLSDFGLTAVRGDVDATTRFLTNRRWRAPEVTTDHYTAECDVYSFAMVLYELFSRMEPFGPDVTLQEVAERAATGKRPQLPTETPRHWAQLIEACWSQDPQQRLSAKVLMRTFRNFAALEGWLGPQLSGSAAPVSLPGTHVRLCASLTAVFQPKVLEAALATLTERVTARLSQAPEAWYALLCMPKLCKVLLLMVFPNRRAMTSVSQMLADDFNGPTWPTISEMASSQPVFSTAEAKFHGRMLPNATDAAVVTTNLRFDEGVEACVDALRKATDPSLEACSAWRGTLYFAQHNAGKLTAVHFFNKDPVSAMTANPKGVSSGIFESTISAIASVLTSTPTIELFAVRGVQWVVAPEDPTIAPPPTSSYWLSSCVVC